VHGRWTTRAGKPIPCGCGEYHHAADPRTGTAIDPESYDYRGAVLWQGHSGDLWHRFTIRLRRELAAAAGIRASDFPKHARLSYAKVAEYQKRGLIHFHAVIGLDGPDGPDDPAPAWADATLLEHAVRAAAETATVTQTPTIDGHTTEHTFTWGSQVDVRAIRPAPHRSKETTARSATGRWPATSPNTPPKAPAPARSPTGPSAPNAPSTTSPCTRTTAG
jgi:hypothetical protein